MNSALNKHHISKNQWTANKLSFGAKMSGNYGVYYCKIHGCRSTAPLTSSYKQGYVHYILTGKIFRKYRLLFDLKAKWVSEFGHFLRHGEVGDKKLIKNMSRTYKFVFYSHIYCADLISNYLR